MESNKITFTKASPESHIKFLENRLDETIRRKTAIEKRFNYLRKQKLPKIIFAAQNQDIIETQAQMVHNLLKENEALYALNRELEEKASEAEKRASEAEGFASYSEDMVQLYQKETEDLRDENEILKAQVFQLEQKLKAKQKEIDSKQEGTPLLVYGDESDLYEGEQKDIILECLRNSLSVTYKGRVHDVIISIIRANPETGIRSKVKGQIASWFKGFTGWDRVNGSKRNEFLNFGFNYMSHNNHPKFLFHDDPRYSIVLSGTASDSRAAENHAAEINKMI